MEIGCAEAVIGLAVTNRPSFRKLVPRLSTDGLRGEPALDARPVFQNLPPKSPRDVSVVLSIEPTRASLSFYRKNAQPRSAIFVRLGTLTRRERTE